MEANNNPSSEKQVLNTPQVITSAVMTVLTDLADCPKKIPFGMLSERMANSIHGQTLHKLNSRGGMTPFELVANIEKVNPFTIKYNKNEEQLWADKLKKYLSLYESGEF